MNLIDLIQRQDRNLVKRGLDLKIVKSQWLGYRWLALLVPQSDAPQLVTHNLLSHFSMTSMPRYVGWYAVADQCVDDEKLSVTIEIDGVKHHTVFQLSTSPLPIFLPWPGVQSTNSAQSPITIKLHFLLKLGNTARILVQQRLNRVELIRYATGRGVEIGPGPHPQIHSSADVDVDYIEEAPIEKWTKLYDPKGKYGAGSADFSRYKIATAWDLPYDDQSLNFIFSSHVIEHLANPLGHIARWKSKLKACGKILAVVPDMCSTKDYLATPSPLEELVHEYQSGLASPVKHHYERWATIRNQLERLQVLMSENISIHVHFYTPQSMASILDYCIKHLGFRKYSIIQSTNHKDFYFILE